MSAGSTKLAIIVVYMPLCGYLDPQVEAIYKKFDVAVKEARDGGRCVAIGSDCNAEANSNRCHTECEAVGRFANTEGNLRGE